jgi:nitrogen fixation/metabolism regulation signal transduction histidine kinase
MPGPLVAFRSTAALRGVPFRRRIFLILVALTAVPITVAVIGWIVTARTLAPTAGSRSALEQVAASARRMLVQVDTTHLSRAERAAYDSHLDQISESLTLARRAETYLRYYTAGFVALVLVLGALALFAAVRLAGHLSRQLSRPIDELVGWTRRIRRHAPLPEGPPTRGAPEFEALRQALREMAEVLEHARDQELEAERLRAFREVARRVAHEIKNPLTSMRIALDQMRRTSGPSDSRTEIAQEVLSTETERLERLAREFADFGRMPEGPKSEIDLTELLQELARTGVPDSVTVNVIPNGAPHALLGHYEPLRRAFANLLRNASEAMGGRGVIDVIVNGERGTVAVTIADHGPGVAEELRQRVFEPYFTTKSDGTGLGLALVRQTVEAHRGSITVGETEGGGATFRLVFPA